MNRPYFHSSTLSSISLFWELLWQHFPPVKTCINCIVCINYWIEYQVLHVPTQEEVARKFSGLEEHSTPTQYLCIQHSCHFHKILA
jgi:hypothetical protein